MIIPSNDFIGNSTGEDFVWQKCREYLPNDVVSFHNYSIGLKQIDQILLVPSLGMLFVEIKGIKAENIFDIPNNTVIRMKNSPQIPSPFLQARNYIFHFMDNYLKPNNIDYPYMVPVVCYPLVSEDEYYDLKLSTISVREITLLRNDFLNGEVLSKKIDDIFKFAYSQISGISSLKFGFDSSMLNMICKFIDPNFTYSFLKPYIQNRITTHNLDRENDEYSRLVVKSKDSLLLDDEIDLLVREWGRGSKIYFYTDSSDYLLRVKSKVDMFLKQPRITQNSNYQSFSLSEYGTFGFSFDKISELKFEMVILNGKDREQYRKNLAFLHENTAFNYDQFEIEHSEQENMIVKAGAGTGKTFSIISRINYLIWANKYSPDDLRNKIVMITFTNESADSMKKKLTENFTNYFLLTQDTRYLKFIESVENMHISTIHSISKKLLSKYSSELGYGKDFRIVSGSLKKAELLRKELDKLIEKQVEFPSNVTNFVLTQRLLELMSKFDNKNIDIVADYSRLKFGKELKSPRFEFIEVIRETQTKLNEYNLESNSICLGELIRKQRLLYKRLKESSTKVEKIDYLIIDEFQDTDDIQIEIIHQFQSIFNYKLFVVGDIKQCIYRFRGAEVKAFDKLIELGRHEKFIEITLAKNYRTFGRLMGHLNQIFAAWHDQKLIEYAPKERLISTKLSNDNSVYDIYSIDSSKSIEHLIASTLKSCEVDLASHEKIAILVRTNNEVMKVKKICDQNKIRVDIEIGGDLFRIDPTIDFYKLVLALKNHNSSEYLYNLYTTSYIRETLPKFELVGLDSNEVISYFHSNLPDGLEEWSNYIERLRVEPVLRVLRELVEKVKPWEIFAGKMGFENDKEYTRIEQYYMNNLDQLFEKLVTASSTDYITMNRICDYLDIMILTRFEEESRASFDMESSMSDIICTTVHKSKGLEFDTVVIPFTSLDINSQKYKGNVDVIYLDNSVGYKIQGNESIKEWKDKVILENDIYIENEKIEESSRILEEARILYVALTRAKRKIIVLTDTGQPAHNNSKTWQEMLTGVKQ